MTIDIKLRTLIVDDEPFLRLELAKKLGEHPNIEIIGQCANGIEAVEAIHQHQPDLVYLDIVMPGLNGFQVIHAIQADAMPIIIFATAYDQYAIKAFEVRAVDYLVKPYSDQRLNKSVETALLNFKSPLHHNKEKLINLGSDIQNTEFSESSDSTYERWPDELVIETKDPRISVKVTEIAWIDAAGDYMCVHANGETFILRSTMKNLEEKLNPQQFRRIHRSTIINIGFIENITPHQKGDYFIDVKEGTRLRLSRSYKENLADIIDAKF